MSSMMEEEDDGEDAVSVALRSGSPDKGASGSFLQLQDKKQQSAKSSTMDDYIKDSEDGLSAALGPRWNAKTLDENAEKSTKAMLHGISGGEGTYIFAGGRSY